MVSVHFNHVDEHSEQRLVEELVHECIHLRGMDVYYVMRRPVAYDPILNESQFSEFGDAVLIDAYLNDAEGQTGDGYFMEKFGLENRFSYQFQVSSIGFAEDVTAARPDVKQPREGDAIYVPMMRQLYVIKFAEPRAYHYQMGSLQAWNVDAELYEAHSDVFDTGIPEIDAYYKPLTEDVHETGICTEAGEFLADQRNWILTVDQMGDPVDPDTNVALEDRGDEFIDFDTGNPFVVGPRY